MYKPPKFAWISALTIILASTSSGALAQDGADLLAISDNGTLRGEVQTRFDAALAATRDVSVSAANDPRYLWASEAKIQCGIALGYLKSNTRDETSISKCDYAFQRMTFVQETPQVAPPPPPQPPAAVCDDRQPALIFFAWDSDLPDGDASQTIQSTAATAAQCGWNSFRVIGHTDLSGSDAYNDELSQRRSQAVADLMVSLGINRGQMSISSEGESNPRVPTQDGVREPQNRRVEITVSQ
ncbi:MAG: OmpA family protein [Erythrobacter sp.]